MPVWIYLTWTKSSPRRSWFFRSNSYSIKVMVISLIEMLELPNFGHMTTLRISFESRDKILLVTSWTKIMMSKSNFQNTFILRWPIWLISSILKPYLWKQPLQTQKKKKLAGLEYMYQNEIYICIFLYNKISWFSLKLFLQTSAELKGYDMWFITFFVLL